MDGGDPRETASRKQAAAGWTGHRDLGRTRPGQGARGARAEAGAASATERAGVKAEPSNSASDRVSILVVDDEPSIRELLVRVLLRWGYEATAVESGDAALAVLRNRRITLMLCDQLMPGLVGTETLDAALAIDPSLAVIVFSGAHDARLAAEALTRGAIDFVTKPFDVGELQLVIQRALRKRALAREQGRVERLIREEVAIRTEELERERQRLRALTVGIVESLITAMEAKDDYLRGHSQRVADLAASIAHQMGYEEEMVEQVRLAGRLHDVGKIGVRADILNKPDRLTPEEYEHVKDHVRLGVQILSPLRHIGDVLEFVHDHHERWDGGGYPRGRRGAQISPGGRILAAADTFDALTSARAHRRGMAPTEALVLMETLSGRHLNPDVFAALRDVVAKQRVLPFLDHHSS